jgi:SAM-dependent methyltransferase
MTQNIYDDPGFFAGYSQLPRSVHGLAGAPEWPSLQRLLPDLKGKRVLDLGCGFGWFCRWARAAGAAAVLGLDVSERMLARARAETTDPAIAYRRADLETVDLATMDWGNNVAPGPFDLIYSSLAFHYLENLDRLIGQVAAVLAPAGRLVFSVEHPICTAPSNPGWISDAEGRKLWPVERYLDEGPRATNWLAEGVIKQHRSIATYLNLLLDRGLVLEHLEEWSPSEAQIAAEPSWADERQRPFFLLIACRR